MSRLENSKLVPYVVTGPDHDTLTMSKIVVYAILQPDPDYVPPVTNSQGHVFVQYVSE